MKEVNLKRLICVILAILQSEKGKTMEIVKNQ